MKQNKQQLKAPATDAQCRKNRNAAAFRLAIENARNKAVPLIVFDEHFLTQAQQHEAVDFERQQPLANLLELCRSLERHGFCSVVELISEQGKEELTNED